MVARNSAILEEGYIHGAELLSRLQPDILVGGHSFVMGRPAAFIERFRRWSYEMRDPFQTLSPDPDYRYGFDPYWVRAEPYRTVLRPGQPAEIALHVRNFRPAPQRHRIALHAPPGVTATPALWEGELPAASRDSLRIRLEATPAVAAGVAIVPLDVARDGQRLGERFDLIVEASADGAPQE